jgi:hypothetical protein
VTKHATARPRGQGAVGRTTHGTDERRILRELARKLRQRRIALGLTLDEAALHTGLAWSDLQRLEHDGVATQPWLSLQYATALGMNL